MSGRERVFELNGGEMDIKGFLQETSSFGIEI
jgi:hypothetical protein